MEQRFISLYHCKCGMSWKKGTGFFQRTDDMVFCLEHNYANKKPRRIIKIKSITSEK